MLNNATCMISVVFIDSLYLHAKVPPLELSLVGAHLKINRRGVEIRMSWVQNF